MDKDFKKLILFGSGSVVIAITVFLLAAAFSILYQYNDESKNRLTFTGNGEVTFTPTIASFSFTVTQLEDTVKEAREQVSEDIDNIYSYLIDELETEEKDIKTNSYRIYPKYEFIPVGRTTRRDFVGYEVAQVTSVTFEDFDDAELALTFISDNGATNVSSLIFTARDEEIKGFRREAEKKAIDEARQKARETARNLGIDLGAIVGYSTTGNPRAFRKSGFLTTERLSEEAPRINVDIAPGEGNINLNVNITYEFK